MGPVNLLVRSGIGVLPYGTRIGGAYSEWGQIFFISLLEKILIVVVEAHVFEVRTIDEGVSNVNSAPLECKLNSLAHTHIHETVYTEIQGLAEVTPAWVRLVGW